MKVIVTGSLGNISQPLTKELVQQGHAVTVISSKPDKKAAIEALGATAAIGSLEDGPFLVATFTGADAVYCMVPPNYFTEPDMPAYYRQIGGNYAQAIAQAGVKRVVNLSSMGAELAHGTGLIMGSHYVEGILNALTDVTLTHLRPTYFNYNLLGFVALIKAAGRIMANYGGDDPIVLVSPLDIAAAVADELATPATGHRVRYVASEERSAREIASILGTAIGKPDLAWEIISNEQMQSSLEANGVPPLLATHLVDMYASVHSGALFQDYYRHKPAVMGKVKMTDFAPEFAAAYQRS